MIEWSTLKKLIWLHILQGASAIIKTVTGTAPLVLTNAVNKAITELTQYGKCVQDGTPTPDAPVDIVCNNGALKWDSVNQRVYADGTDEVLTVRGVNLFDKNTMDTGQGYYVNNSGNIVNGYNANRTVWIPCKPNTKYSYWHTGGAGGCRAFAMNKETIDTSDTSEWLKGSPAYLGKDVVSTVTTPADAVKLYITAARSNLDPERSFDEQLADFMVVEGDIEEAFAYQPYHEPQTVTDIPMLLSVRDAKDEKDIISGGVTHRIGCHVFDGTETFSKSSAYGQAFLINAASASWGADRTASVLCTHFLGLPQTKSSQEDNTCFFNQTGHFYFRVTDNSDPDAFKAWLAAEYAAGHPVIVWFVLAEETTEQGAPHALHTTEGDNVVSVVSNVDPVALECEYAQAAAPSGDNKVGTAVVGTAKAG